VSARPAAFVVVVVVLLGVVAPACRPSEPKANVVVKDDGVLCLGAPVADPDAGPAGLAEVRANDAIPIAVRAHGCLVDRCATARKARCSAKREGKRIVVTSELSWLAPESMDPCPGPCSFLDAKCSLEGGLEPGSYTFVLGKQSYAIDVPSRVPSACVAAPRAPGAASGRAAAGAPPGAPTGLVPVAPPAQASGGAGGKALEPAAVADLAAAPSTGAPPSPPPPPDERVCFKGPPPPAKATSRAAPKTTVTHVSIAKRNACEGNECLRAVAPRCAVRRKGSHLVVTATWNGAGGKPVHSPCTEDCPSLLATCKTGPLPAGTYSVEAFGQTGELTLPAPPTPTCLP
jgi:hypothetical protein